jgi:methylthioribose-1-phosphate isomerase
MKVNCIHYHSIWETPNKPTSIQIIDQRKLPHFFIIEELKSLNDFVIAIKDMHLRGAPLIGIAAAYAIANTAFSSKKATLLEFDANIKNAYNTLLQTRPTAINLKWALEKQINELNKQNTIKQKIESTIQTARNIANEELENCKKIGQFGLELIEMIYTKKNSPVNILTHCNAGWLATIDYGTATAPIYFANEKNIPIHIWVDETRPRNQGTKLTAWELKNENIPYSIIADNTGGLLMMKGMVDIVIVGSDRTTAAGDVANKIGTYLKALAAKANNVPFYVALPTSTIDWTIDDGISQIPLEIRNPDEILYIDGLYEGEIIKVLIAPEDSNALNFAFDITPAQLISGLITEKGICYANKESISSLKQ